MDVLSFVLNLFPSLLIGITLYYWQRKQVRRDAKVDARAEARKQEALIMMELQIAIAKLSYAVAMAVKRGTPNGEVDDGIDYYTETKNKYMAFLKEQTEEHLH